MATIINKFAEYIKSINCEEPEAFAIALIIIFTIMKKWGPLFLVILTMIIGAKIEDYINYDMIINGVPVGASFIVYIIGAIIICFATFLSMFNK